MHFSSTACCNVNDLAQFHVEDDVQHPAQEPGQNVAANKCLKTKDKACAYVTGSKTYSSARRFLLFFICHLYLSVVAQLMSSVTNYFSREVAKGRLICC